MEKLNPGYPCHKYITRNLKTQKDVSAYAKAFITTLVSTKYADFDMCLSLLQASLAMVELSDGTSIPDFYKFGIDSKTACLNIINNTDSPPFKACNTYYKKFDSKVSSCRLCPVSKLFFNNNESIELSVMKYMLTDKRSFDFVVDYINEDFFRSVIDVCVDLPSNKAYVVSILKELTISSLKSNIRINLFDRDSLAFLENSISPFDILWEDVISRIPRDYRIPVSLTKNSRWAAVLKQIVFNKINEAKSLPEDELVDLLNNYIANDGLSPSETKEEFVSVSVFDMDFSSLAQTESANNTKVDPKPVLVQSELADTSSEDDDDSNVTDGDAFSEESNISGLLTADEIAELQGMLADEIALCQENDEPPVEYSDSMLFEEKSSLSAEDIKALEEMGNGIVSEDVSCANNEASLEVAEISTQQSDEGNNTAAGPVAVPAEQCSVLKSNPLHNNIDMITHIYVSSDYIENYFIKMNKTSSLPPKAINSFLSQKIMPIEVVRCSDNTFGFVIYSHYTKEFYFYYSDNVSEEVSSLISRQMIVKVCHTPYYLYGVCKLHGMQVRNVFSLQTMHVRATGLSNVRSYMSFIKVYTEGSRIKNIVSIDMQSGCVYTYGMQYYHSIYRIISNMLEELPSPLLIEIDRCVDESVGSSFLYKRNFDDNGLLTALLPNGKFEYKEEFRNVPLTDGKFVNYMLTGNSKKIAYNYFRYLLYRLSSEAYMRKLNIQLVGWKDSYISFFVGLECYDYFVTMISIFTYDYGYMYPARRLNIQQLVRDALSKK